MPQWHGDLRKRKPSGGRRKAFRGKRAYEMGSDPAATVVGEPRIVSKRGRGGNIKLSVLATNFANVTDPATGKTEKTEIRSVVKNPANVDYQRRGVITKGSNTRDSARASSSHLTTRTARRRECDPSPEDLS